MTKTLNVGMVGYGFMARAHSNAWSKVSHFFDTGYKPVLKAVAARNGDKAAAFAARWGYEAVETDWRTPGRAARYRRDRHLHAERHAMPRSPSPRRRPARWCSARSRSPAPRPRRKPMVEAVETAGVPQHGLVQLSPRAGGVADQAA